MVAKIKSGKSLIGALNYNENKVKQGKAKLIEASGYPKDKDDLNFYDKLQRLTDLAEGNQRTQTNTVHISLNFPNGESLPDETLKNITQDYMRGIGFEGQPYLVYRHEDAGHPHIHIVSTNIKRNTDRISLHYLGQNQSEQTRKAIEIQYNLVKAEEQQKQKPSLKAEVETVVYGKAETKRAITNILCFTVRAYKFTSIPELNAVLQQYNIQADRGAKDSRMYAREGLVYWVLDKAGNKIGVPIKASTIYGKPTLKTLEEKFQLNGQLRKPFKAEIIKSIDQVLVKPQTQGSFQKALQAKGIQVILRKNEEDRIYGVTFIDQKNKAVFNGSDLGKAYSANQLSARLQSTQPNEQPPVQRVQQTETSAAKQNTENDTPQKANHHESTNTGDDLLDILFAPEREDQAALNKFKKKRKKGLNI
jgi:hypothetical protein